MNTREEIMKMLVLVAENFNAAPSSAQLRLVCDELEKHPFQAVSDGLMRLMRTRQYPGFPPLAEFINAVAGGTPDELARIAAADAWGRFLAALDEYNPWTRKEPAVDEITAQVVHSLGGWDSLYRELNLKNFEFRQRRFIQLYSDYHKHGLPAKRQLGYGQKLKTLATRAGKGIPERKGGRKQAMKGVGG